MADVVLRTGDSEVCRIACGTPLQAFAMRWSYVVRQRHRWADDPASRQRQTVRLQRDLRGLGINARALKRLRGIVEVSVPDSPTDQHWEARILPWEYVLAAATKPYRDDDPILIVRHLAVRRRKRTRRPRNYQIIETAPGELGRHFDFSAERSLVTGSLQAMPHSTGGVLENPTDLQLRQQLQSQAPDVIHVTGVDTRSGRRMLRSEMAGVRDGLFLADPSGEASEVRAETIAEALNQGSPSPLFVGFNCWNSGARLAPMTIRRGAGSAIGFQHTFDDAVAELFFLNFYRTCIETDWNRLSGFWSAWQSVAGYRRRIRGSSIILWSADSLVAAGGFDAFQSWRSEQSTIGTKTRCAVADVARIADPALDRAADLMQVTVRPKPQLNYSSLHNGETVFDEFTFRLDPEWFCAAPEADSDATETARGTLSQIHDIDVDVELHVGSETFPFRTRLSLGGDSMRYDLAGCDAGNRHRHRSNQHADAAASGVRLPLTSRLFRSLSERIQTSLFVNVSWHDQVLYRHTHSVWLAPVDQWTLDDAQLGWLPSFVQPRDPAVAKTIDVAHNYLRCLVDRTTVGFDGYQSYDGLASGDACWVGVDRQVQAIWSALLLESKLRYINPPPSYSEFTQRLRTPSETVVGGFGTCVDLAILLASCLEWIEIHPVLFLLHGHVFPGYWKDLKAHREFVDVLTDDLPAQRDAGEVADDQLTQRWVSGRKTYAELKGFVDRGQLVPLESVGLTSGQGFTAAIDSGREHFYKRRNRSFRAMIDLVSARQRNGVTPLPLFVSDATSGPHG
ncbi:hypothetical protein NHH03_19520 [Stieleria sp. TO1_6]|uniref:hypothetical protein n=1 Tax=Stieleria tagensis TaxID=2956795 RepID=UPI00209B3B7C|nr:hypothetical protein [Stieleria tagensis]MCO8123943.1 hypothetical protein [Stieleria tagensis]